MLTLEKILGYCPITNDTEDSREFLKESGIPTNGLGYEVLSNHENLPGGKSLAELTHELLLRLYLQRKDIMDIKSLQNEVLECLMGYIFRTISRSGDELRTFEFRSLTDKIFSNKDVILNIEALHSYLEQFLNWGKEKDSLYDRLIRKIEFCSYYTLCSVQTALLDILRISSVDHAQYLTIKEKCTTTSPIISRCFEPITEKITYGQGSFKRNQMQKYDTWMEGILPELVHYAPYPQNNEGLQALKQFNGVLEELRHITSDPSILVENIKYMAISEDQKDFRKTMCAAITLIFFWKDGVALLTWIPVFGDIFSLFGNTALGRSAGVIGAMYLIKDVEFKLSLRMFFVKENFPISMVALGLLLGSIFAI